MFNTSNWLAGLYCPSGSHLFIENIDDAYTFLNGGTCLGPRCVAVVNHIHAGAIELLKHLRRNDINKELAVVIATNEDVITAAQLCSHYGAHAFVKHSNASTELQALFGAGFAF